MKLYSIENTFIHLQVSSFGAEIYSLYSKNNQTEYIWNADSQYWAKRAPILFPFIGELKNGSYRYMNKQYPMTKHGFARDSVFELVNHEKDTISFRLVDNADTHQIYPFNFELLVTYSLVGNQMSCAYELINTGTTQMYFNIGGHPAFRLPKLCSTSYSLIFNHDKELKRYYIVNGLLANENDHISLPSGRLPLTATMFDKDAWVFKDLQSRSVILQEDKSNNQVFEVEFDDFNNLVLWSVKDAPFVCIEPCCGYNDLEVSSRELKDKEGIMVLDAKQSICKQWSFKILD